MTLSATSLVAIGIIAGGATAVMEPGLIGVLRRRGVLDQPSARSSHTTPTVRGGGVAIALTSLVVLAVALPHDLLGGLLLSELAAFALLGLADDLASLPPLTRLMLQILLGGVAVTWGLHHCSSSPPTVAALGAVCLVGTVATVNAFNFMDGINGISTAQTLVVGANGVVIGVHLGQRDLSYLAVAVGASTLAFGPFNFPRARAFLGDCGSYFLGATAAAISVLALRSGAPLEAALAPLLLYVSDTAGTVGRRIIRGKHILEPHREHVYQRSTQAGWSHARMTTVYFALAIAVAALGDVSLSDSIALRAVADGAALGMAGLYLSIPRLLRRRNTP